MFFGRSSPTKLLKTLIKENFSYLFTDFGFKIVESKDYSSFGGGYVILRSDKCSLKVDWNGKDGEVTLELNQGKHPKGWKPSIYGVLTKGGKDPSPSIVDDLKDNWHWEDLWYGVLRLLNSKVIKQSGKDVKELTYVFPHYYPKEVSIPWQVKRLARIIKPYCAELIEYVDKTDLRASHEKSKDKPAQALPDFDWSFLDRNDRVGELIKGLSKQHISYLKDPNKGSNGIMYSCCSAVLKDGRILDCVCIVDKDEFKSIWGNDYDGMLTVEFSDIKEIKQSPYALISLSGHSDVYTASEVPEEFYKFRLNLKDKNPPPYTSKKFPYKVKRLVNFLELPEGYTMAEVTFVSAYYETKAEGPIDSTDYWKDGYLSNRQFYWCLA